MVPRLGIIYDSPENQSGCNKFQALGEGSLKHDKRKLRKRPMSICLSGAFYSSEWLPISLFPSIQIKSFPF